MERPQLEFIRDVLSQNVITFNKLKMEEARGSNASALNMVLKEIDEVTILNKKESLTSFCKYCWYYLEDSVYCSHGHFRMDNTKIVEKCHCIK
jgi:hypothetical protein